MMTSKLPLKRDVFKWLLCLLGKALCVDMAGISLYMLLRMLGGTLQTTGKQWLYWALIGVGITGFWLLMKASDPLQNNAEVAYFSKRLSKLLRYVLLIVFLYPVFSKIFNKY